MAEEDSGQERTEQPTAKREEDARKKGQIARSRELNTMAVMLVYPLPPRLPGGARDAWRARHEPLREGAPAPARGCRGPRGVRLTGAGDTVIATLALALAAGASLGEASVLANCAAGVVVGKVGTAQTSPDEVLAAAGAAAGGLRGADGERAPAFPGALGNERGAAGFPGGFAKRRGTTGVLAGTGCGQIDPRVARVGRRGSGVNAGSAVLVTALPNRTARAIEPVERIWA